MGLSIVILAAGQGKRMRSQVPKVLHRLAGKTLLEHVVGTAEKLNPDQVTIVVYGHQGDSVPHALANLNVMWVEQKEQLGTGHAFNEIYLDDKTIYFFLEIVYYISRLKGRLYPQKRISP